MSKDDKNQLGKLLMLLGTFDIVSLYQKAQDLPIRKFMAQKFKIKISMFNRIDQERSEVMWQHRQLLLTITIKTILITLT